MHVNASLNTTLSPFYTKEWYFAPHLQQAGFTVGIFGKHLNDGYTANNPACPPIGVDRWFANGGGTYYGPEFNNATAGGGPPNGARYNNCTYTADGACYSTSVIANETIAWIEGLRTAGDKRPFFAYVAPKAPHIEDGNGWPIAQPSPWYNGSAIFEGRTAPRTPNWNASAPDHHWLVRTQPPMTDEQRDRSDTLFRARWLSLLSVDDMVEGLVSAVTTLDEIDSTFFLFTSDHGFQLGQFRMPEGKWNAYENDVRIPMVIAGPGIKHGSEFDFIATNVDTMPTVLGLAGIPTPPSMDGRSYAHLVWWNYIRCWIYCGSGV
jgi:N-acetylglucosamine-6-sulfatase